MRHIKFLTIVLAGILLIAAFSYAKDNGRIYGKITTVDGDTFKGPIRWDKNEGNWVDVLDGTKEMDRRDRRSKRKYSRRRSNFEIFGISVGTGGSVYYSGNAQSGIRFGHIEKLEVLDDNSAMLYLKSGEQVEMYNGSTDIGTSIREIVIEDENEGEIELVWDDIEMIEFSDSDDNFNSVFGDRLYGTLTTRRGDEFTGFICWDVDELFYNDILDGDNKGRSRKIKFGKIDTIERYSSSGATVILKNGDDLLLKGTNDVNESNSGIIVSDPSFGQIIVKWNEFDNVKFYEPSEKIKYSQFDGGKPLKGTVYTEDGDEFTGRIRWDDDEEYTWELLDGNFRKIAFDIEFGKIKSIEKRSYKSSIVTVLDGRSFRLSGSNDVDDDNKGIIIFLDDGEEIEIDWDDFEKVEFDN